MSFEPFQPGDKRLVLIAVLVLAAGLSYTLLNYDAAFPQASLDLQLTKGEIISEAEQFLESRGLSGEDFINLTLFSPDTSARLFLERELGLTEANRLMESEVNVWRWRVRWFRPPEQEERVVFLDPGGRLVGFRHAIPEAQAGARLERDAAFAIAEEFLHSQTGEAHALIEEKQQERPERLDYVFTWEREGFEAKDATYRRTIVVQGDEVGRYAEYLHVPERWEREYAALRSNNELYSNIAQALYVLLALAALAVLFQALRRGQIRWRPLIILSAAAGVLAVLNEWNFLPFYIDAMPTSTKLRDMVLLALFQGLGAGVGYFFYIILGAAPGEPLYRRWAPARLALDHAFSWKGTRTREFFRSTVAGYGFTGAHLAFLVAFYLISRRFGAWSPQDVEYSNVLSTAVPWIYPMTIGVLASTSEEFWWRLLAVPLLKRYTGSTWIAIVVPAFVWGFLHANYPQQPGFIRGVEVGLIGVAAGYLLLRFGIVATLVWHYTVDAVLVSSVLFESDSWYYWLAGIVVSCAILIPLAISLAHYRRNGGFLSDPALLNRAQTGPPPEEKPAAEAEPPPAEPIKPGWPARYLYIAAGVALAAGLTLSSTSFGDFIEIRTTMADAGRIADKALIARDADPSEWRRSARFVTNLSVADFEFYRRRLGPDEANRIVSERTFHGVWQVRYIQPQEPEEWRVYVNQEGKAYRVDHILEETAPGANLSPDEAQRLAAEHLTAVQGIQLDKYRLVDSSANQRENRTDHYFVWEDTGIDDDGAKSRISLSVTGDEVSDFRRLIKLPEEWLREFNRPRLQDYIVPALGGALGFPLLIVFVMRIGGKGSGPRQQFHWRVYLAAAAVAVALSLAGSMNRWSNALIGYNTAEPLENFMSQWLLGRAMQTALIALGVFVLVMAADVFLQFAAGRRRIPRPSALRAAAVGALFWGVFQVQAVIVGHLPGDRFELALWKLPGIDASLPALSALSESVFGAILLVSILVITGAAVYHYLFNRTGLMLAVGLAAVAALGSAAHPVQWMYQFVAIAGMVGLVVLVMKTCGLDLVAFLMAVFCVDAMDAAGAYLGQPAAGVRWQGVAMLIGSLTAGAALLALARRSVGKTPPPESIPPQQEEVPPAPDDGEC